MNVQSRREQNNIMIDYILALNQSWRSHSPHHGYHGFNLQNDWIHNIVIMLQNMLQTYDSIPL